MGRPAQNGRSCLRAGPVRRVCPAPRSLRLRRAAGAIAARQHSSGYPVDVRHEPDNDVPGVLLLVSGRRRSAVDRARAVHVRVVTGLGTRRIWIDVAPPRSWLRRCWGRHISRWLYLARCTLALLPARLQIEEKEEAITLIPHVRDYLETTLRICCNEVETFTPWAHSLR